MEDQTIRPGDLAYVAKPSQCCGNTEAMGLYFTAGRTRLSKLCTCVWCGKIEHDFPVVELLEGVVGLYRLRKIDPPATGEYDRVPVRKSIPTTKEKA